MTDNEYHLHINLSSQTLLLKTGETIVKEYPISSAKNGPGEEMDSECTPRGKHIIAEKIGEGCEINTVFAGRIATSEIYTPEMRQQNPQRDWIITRILWLRGTEPGINQAGNVDSYKRYIYIHGTPDDVAMDKPGSRGCIRMRNADVIELFEQVSVGTSVVIQQ